MGIVVLEFPTIAGSFWRASKAVVPPQTLEKVWFARRSRSQEMRPLYELCRDTEMRFALDALLDLNQRTIAKKDRDAIIMGRAESHEITRDFLRQQISSS